jgi:hypothetical protein
MRYQILYAARDQGQADDAMGRVGARGEARMASPSDPAGYVQLYGR